MPTVLRLRNAVTDNLSSPNVGCQWPSLTCLNRIARVPISGDRRVNCQWRPSHCWNSAAPSYGSHLLHLLHDEKEEWGHQCPILKGSWSSTQSNVGSHKKKLLEFLFLNSPPLSAVVLYALSLWRMNEWCGSAAECPPHKPHCPEELFPCVLSLQMPT